MIFLDTNVISETLKPRPSLRVTEWLTAHDAMISLPSITLAELAYGIERIRPDERAARLEKGLSAWRARFRDRIQSFTETDALAYGQLMGSATRNGHALSIPDGLIAAMSLTRGWALATRNLRDFEPTGIELIDPWR
ncbi:MAG: type II toxin-antitoxin system VapC family toxin [Wenzhouxiangella sp.]|nr:MAG: type II toxin-antitoxin system VapC family toxin [Wenzhouxiangella sp.]